MSEEDLPDAEQFRLERERAQREQTEWPASAGETLSGSGSLLESRTPLAGRPKHVRLRANP